ncbi:unnamed protein product [Pleuronectes platessa]|uniref:Uncharacterized protein n=1 Tax=Pleuronectes platessa TaxID=8262 RepID=A0A9N7VC89_PLEPL|nr:unnamed protein product [Pleuronectes platessa]
MRWRRANDATEARSGEEVYKEAREGNPKDSRDVFKSISVVIFISETKPVVPSLGGASPRVPATSSIMDKGSPRPGHSSNVALSRRVTSPKRPPQPEVSSNEMS